jgi:alpha-D-ribose 1-methylphosphonate 5-triphosphate synthase subunit PhnG
LLDLAEAVAGAGAEVAEPPRPATVMVRLQGPVGTFCLSEVVVTTCSALVDGRPGWACVMGWDPEGALACALLAAEQSVQARELAQAALADEEDARRRRMVAVAATRVGDA